MFLLSGPPEIIWCEKQFDKAKFLQSLKTKKKEEDEMIASQFLRERGTGGEGKRERGGTGESAEYK